MSQGAEPTSQTTPPTPPHGHRPASAAQVPATLVPQEGWHFLHVFYKVDRAALAGLSAETRREGIEALKKVLDPAAPGAPDRLQCFAVPGHKADFGIMLAGADLKAVHATQIAIQASPLGPALVATSSFYSITEVSEYVPDVEEYGRILRDREGIDPESSSYKTKVAAYAARLEPMNQQRLYPDFPDWPCFCFYPMSKMRQGDQNWYLLPFEERSELMSHHGRSGMKFAGRVSQLITASTGIDDWEWGVTLWAKNPSYLKEIVYTMRYDVSSAKYALFGDFFFGYILSASELLDTLRL
ncbi:chlorite dismutase [Singulisphaera sp. GP187]|uniref:hydrogen peroxide-dependent heme synthase n=1 Tax=Singulisphaera sp. GP187 TaxID=1882752 RepID=UPI000928D538|nr:hydrogen peroxide-dependent heme synthase [Singulisphaera sp. GP187]SIO61113.1 chlorite dismutase [Singulisphaera sp. GP187]